jgi:hypothetical protein
MIAYSAIGNMTGSTMRKYGAYLMSYRMVAWEVIVATSIAIEPGVKYTY